MEQDIRPRDIMTMKSFENAVRLVMVLGGSTNATIHLIAMARAAGVDLTLEDFRRLSASTPYVADLKPSGKFVMEDLHQVGGTRCTILSLSRKSLQHLNVTKYLTRASRSNTTRTPRSNTQAHQVS